MHSANASFQDFRLFIHRKLLSDDHRLNKGRGTLIMRSFFHLYSFTAPNSFKKVYQRNLKIHRMTARVRYFKPSRPESTYTDLKPPLGRDNSDFTGDYTDTDNQPAYKKNLRSAKV